MKHQRLFCILVLLIAGLALSWRVWNLFPLYTNARIRDDVRSTLVKVTDREGWLMSNVSLTAIDPDHLTITYRDHHRGADPEACYTVMMNDASLHPCD